MKMTKKVILYLVIITGLIENSFTKSFERNLYQNPKSRIHRIRHQRHLYLNLINPMKSAQYKPECHVKSLDNMKPLPDGCPQKACKVNLDCWVKYDRAQLCVCDSYLCGLVCMEIDLQCQPPVQPANGQANYSATLLVGDQVEYTCKPGFALKGPRKRYCQGNLRLSGSEPECTDQTDLCFSAPYIPHTQVHDGSNRDDYKNGEEVKIICQNGYEDPYKNHVIAKCNGNEWKYNPIKCEKKSCGKLEDPKNGRTMYNNNYTYQSIAIQFCNDGFKIQCLTDQFEDKNCRRQCQAEGKWSGDTALCTAILCPELPPPENGEVMGVWNTVNSIKTFKCKEGFQLHGSHLRKCTREGNWDGSNSACIVRNCGPPPEIPFAKVLFEATTHGAQAEYKCKSGSTLIGETSFLTCGEIDNKSGWLPKPEPQCLLYCRPFRVDYAKVYIYENNRTTNLIMHDDVTHGTHVKVKCNFGYELNSDILPACHNGSWNFVPKCVEAACSTRPPSMKYSTVRFLSLKHDSLARYYCHFGYYIVIRNDGIETLSTTFDIKCNKGNWTKVPSEGCQPKKCMKPPTPKNGEIYLLGQSDRTRLTDKSIKPIHNRVVKYECHPLYRLKGPKIAVCLNGNWSPSQMPICEFIMHDELPISWLYYRSDDKK